MSKWILVLSIILTAAAFADLTTDEAIAKLKERDSARKIAATKPAAVTQAEVDHLRAELTAVRAQLVAATAENEKMRAAAKPVAAVSPARSAKKLGHVPTAEETKAEDDEIRSLPPAESIPQVGDENSVAAMMADPKSLLNKEVVVCGAGRIDDWYRGGFENSNSSHYSISFCQMDATASRGETMHVFASRLDFKPLIDRMIKVQSIRSADMVFRAKVRLTKRCIDNRGKWDEDVELVDWQIMTKDRTGWRDWHMSP